MHDHLTRASLAGAIALTSLAVAVLTALAIGLLTRRRSWALLAAATAGGAFQLSHFSEHLAQAGYWITHSDEAPWMTPWAAALADSFGRLASGTPSFGMEALHLVGNTIFLAAAVAILAVVRRAPTDSRRPARIGVVAQAVHVAEHVSLTVSVLMTRRALGFSTLFGTLDPGPRLWSYRVWWHLSINAIATTLAAIALIRWRRQPAGNPPPYPAVAA
jgi:hypothetical protein